MEYLEPLGNNVFVKPVTEETMSRGGIIIPDTAKEKPQEGEVIATGPGKMNKKGELLPMEVKVGDRIIFAKYSGSQIEIDGVKYLIMPDSDILAVKVNPDTAKAAEAPAKSKARGKKNG